MPRPSKYAPRVRKRFVRLKRLQREVVELTRANEILKKASAGLWNT
jgi:hypothetical protein